MAIESILLKQEVSSHHESIEFLPKLTKKKQLNKTQEKNKRTRSVLRNLIDVTISIQQLLSEEGRLVELVSFNGQKNNDVRIGRKKKNQTNLDLAVFKEGEPIRDFR